MLPVRIEPEALTAPIRAGTLTGYESAVHAIAAAMGELGLPLPRGFTVFVYPSRGDYAQALAKVGGLSLARAGEIAEDSVGFARPVRLLLNDGALRGARRSTWLGVVAHELTHLAQYELSGGRRARSEQWLREGMADWVTSRVLERLGEGTFRHRREQACRAVARGLLALGDEPFHLTELGRPQEWEARARGAKGRLLYRLAYILTDDLIRRRGVTSLIAYFRAFAESDDRLDHFQRAFGLSWKEFERAAPGRIREEVRRCSPILPTESPGGPSPSSEARVLDELEENRWDPD